ncbi:MAG: DUF4153 domain-containing protein [Alphaproteobacteria bacterium]
MVATVVKRLVSIDDLKDTALRFPLPVACALGAFLYAALLNYEVLDLDGKVPRAFACVSALYLWFGIITIISESKKLSFVPVGVTAVVIAVGICILMAYSPVFWLHYYLLLPALLLGISIAPYMFGGDDWSFWQYNREVWLGAALSFLAALLLGGGLSAALVAIEYLFFVDVDEKLYINVWIFAGIILAPVYALSRVPKRFDFTEDECAPPPGLGFIVNWVSAPVVFVYLAILYAYFVQIIVLGNIPSGHLAYLITGFIGSGVLTYLLAWPLYARGDYASPQLRLFYKVFFPALFIPIGFHFFAIWERVSAYGITEQRYVLIISAFWFLIIAMVKSLPSVPLRVIPMTLCVLFALASFGPWGAVAVSGHSQFKRLEGLLNKYDLPGDDGHVVKLENAAEMITLDDRIAITSVIQYLCRRKRGNMIKPWFYTEGEKFWSCLAPHLTKKIGFEPVYYRSSRRGHEERFYVYSKHQNVVDVRGYDFMVMGLYAVMYESKGYRPWEKTINFAEHNKAVMRFEGHEIRIEVDEYEPIVVDIADYMKGKTGAHLQKDDMGVAGENKDLSYWLRFNQVSGEMKEGAPFPTSVRFDLLFRVNNSSAGE